MKCVSNTRENKNRKAEKGVWVKSGITQNPIYFLEVPESIGESRGLEHLPSGAGLVAEHTVAPASHMGARCTASGATRTTTLWFWPGKEVKDGHTMELEYLGSCTHLEEASGSQFWICPSLATEDIWGVDQMMEDFSLPLLLSVK